MFCTISVFAQIEYKDAEQLLKLAQENTAFYETDFSGKYTVVQEKPGEGKNLTEAIMYRRDRTEKWTILVTGPAKEKGKVRSEGKEYVIKDGDVVLFRFNV